MALRTLRYPGRKFSSPCGAPAVQRPRRTGPQSNHNAPAWSGLAGAYGLRAVYGLGPGSDAMTKMESAARKAVELDDSSAEAHTSLSASYFFFAWDPQRDLAEADRALALNSRFTQSNFLPAA